MKKNSGGAAAGIFYVACTTFAAIGAFVLAVLDPENSGAYIFSGLVFAWPWYIVLYLKLKEWSMTDDDKKGSNHDDRQY